MNQNIDPVDRTRRLRDDIPDVSIEDKVDWFYNPIDYAWSVHRQYLEVFGGERKHAVFLGMNPGPWGMGQTGVPFGDPYIVRDWMEIGEDASVGTPENIREERPVHGFSSDRKEGSGQRLFGYFRERFESVPAFFESSFVLNYCPLLMFSPEGKNLTPSDLLKADRERIYEICDPYVRDMVSFYQPEVLVGIGKFGTERLQDVFPDRKDDIYRIPHPSPASPIATRDGGEYWKNLVTERLRDAELL